jgi:pimeloyl-ACP methyl ester carboxylesterase
MDILLIGGLWLDESAWDDVAAELRALGHRPLPVALPGQTTNGTKSATPVTLDDQLSAVLATLDEAANTAGPDGKVFVVGHSAACSLAWLAADARPGRVGKVALIGGFPSSDGDAYADFFAVEDGMMAFPGWEPFAGPDSDDLDEAARQAFTARAIPVPEGVAKGVVRLTDERRHDVPVVLVCPEFSPDQAREWITGNEVPELAKAKHVEYADIDSGHWPMFTQPAALARLLADAA